MKFIYLFLVLILLGCKSQVQNKPSQNGNVLISQILTDLIHAGRIKDDVFIYHSLKPYEYYEIDISEDGLIIPPKDPFVRNELDIVESLQNEKFPNDSSTLLHLKMQILDRPKIKTSFYLNSLLENLWTNSEDLPEEFYVFYIPLYNIDSTAMYLQYDYFVGFPGGYGEGGAFLLEKDKDGTWFEKEWKSTWEN
ncbi:hypothetical protein [Algoriphagus sp. PAP.12]|uniref:hypothetical protein n=1 Tax=Algoriphagus sp. PAP.12 TaxID=2996678 RepID=UPI00227C1C0D|nr:hypothetical protein [Algoriphagus sp. PAP.12]